MKIVFDTYAWIEYFEGTKKGEKVEEYLKNNEIITPAIVLLELSYKADKENWNCKEILNFIKIYSKIVISHYQEDIFFRFLYFWNKKTFNKAFLNFYFC